MDPQTNNPEITALTAMALLHKAAFFPELYSGATIVRLVLSKVLS